MPEALIKLKRFINIPFAQLQPAQRLTMLMVFILTIIGTAVVLRWATQPEYSVLVSDVEPADAQSVIDLLKSNDISYKLVQDGRGIMVPRKYVHEYRMKLAANNMTSSSSAIGYELFDKKDIGISEFVQQVNYRRALEGELARTIQTMPEVLKARVHIVFPKERLFKQDQKEPTSSIFLSLKPGIRLTEQQINGIRMLVSGSIEGLTENNVTLVDDHGNILSKKSRPESMAGLNDGQLEVQMRVENYLEEKAQSMLDHVLGPGNAIVRLSSELDFRRIEKTSEMYDEKNAAILSEEIQSQTSTDSISGSENTSEHTITNYQLPKSIEHVINDVGSIKRLSVAILVNGKYEEKTNPDGTQSLEFVARESAELNRLASLVQNAVGIDRGRGDQVDVQCIPFENPWNIEEVEQNRWIFLEKYGSLLQKLFIAVVMIFGFFIVRKKFSKAREALLKIEPYHSEKEVLMATKNEPEQIEKRREEAAELPQLEPGASSPMRKEVVEFVKSNPSSAAQLVKAWMLED